MHFYRRHRILNYYEQHFWSVAVSPCICTHHRGLVTFIFGQASLKISTLYADLLKVFLLHMPNFLTENFAQKNRPKMPLKPKQVKLYRLLSSCAKIIKCLFFLFCVQRSNFLLQICKNLAQTCVCTSATFRTSDFVSANIQCQDLMPDGAVSSHPDGAAEGGGAGGTKIELLEIQQ